MDEALKWLPDADGTVWRPLADAMRVGLPVPAGFIASASATEGDIRQAYEKLKLQERTHFVAVRGLSHAVLNVIYPDAVVHTLHRLQTESPTAPILVQRMIYASWCGRAAWQRKNLQVKANEGMTLLDPDTYILNTNGKCIRRSMEPKQRKMIRHVDGTAKTVEREGERSPIPEPLLAKIAELASRVGGNIGWAVDDLECVWLLSCGSIGPSM
jgi:hypothetical protein